MLTICLTKWASTSPIQIGPINELPLSQRQMVEIAKVVARDPRVIIFDEASSALGREQASWLIGYCRGLAAKGKIIIFISHKLSEIREVADRITVFRNGANVGTFGSEEQICGRGREPDARTRHGSPLSTPGGRHLAGADPGGAGPEHRSPSQGRSILLCGRARFWGLAA